jgi:GT2 family glycosyltransferase
MLTISLVLYKNNITELKPLFESIKSYTGVYHFFIIDNSPTDILKYGCNVPNSTYIFNNANIGFGAAHNIAIRKAIEIGSTYHLVINPDVYFYAGMLEKIIEFMEQNQDIGNLMPKVLYPDGSIQYLCKLLPTPYDWIGRRFSPFKKMVEKRNEKFELRFTGYNKIMDVPYLSGCFMFLNLNIIKQVGLFDTNIFMYGEETDLCRRIIKAGYRTVFYPEAFIYHEFQKGSHKSWRLTWIGIKSSIYYFNKWGWFFDRERKMINKRVLS